MKCSYVLYEMVAINNKMLKSSTGESYLSAMAAINKMISKGNDENNLFMYFYISRGSIALHSQ